MASRGKHDKRKSSGSKGKGKAVAKADDPALQYAAHYWSTKTEKKKPYSAKVVEDIYGILKAKNYPGATVTELEFSHYLENYLLPNYDAKKASPAHLLSIALIVNEKFLEGHAVWPNFTLPREEFSKMLSTAMEMITSSETTLSVQEQKIMVVFFVRCFGSLENELLREELQHCMGLGTWSVLMDSRREAELVAAPKLRKGWKIINKRLGKLPESEQALQRQKFAFVHSLIQRFFEVLDRIPESGGDCQTEISYCERVLEFIVDILALLTTRRYLNTVIDASHLVVKCSLSALTRRADGHLFCQLLDLVRFYSGFEINDVTGEPMTETEMLDKHYATVLSLQRLLFENYPDTMKDFALSNVSAIDHRDALVATFNRFNDDELRDVCTKLHFISNDDNPSREFMMELIAFKFERRLSQLDALNEMPLYPNEHVLWDENIVPSQYYVDGCLALPKLNIQFLTMFDYLLRNLNLFNMEATYEIREDIQRSISRLKPFRNAAGDTLFGGWARMALPIIGFNIVSVSKPLVGKSVPSSVRADIKVHLNVQSHIKREWQSLRKHDVGFLITVQAPNTRAGDNNENIPFPQRYGIVTVRGCEVEGMLDASGHVIDERPDENPVLPTTDDRTFRVWLDPNQYQSDLTSSTQGGEDVYETFNVFMRRNPKENNFKAVLETIRDLMNTHCVVPEWLHDLFLGYGDPAAANYRHMKSQIASQNFNDTFLSLEHLKAAFPSRIKAEKDTIKPPFRLNFPIKAKKPQGMVPRNVSKKAKEPEPEVDPETLPIVAKEEITLNRGPYPFNQPKRNAVAFTPTQAEAIRSGMQPGLTMVVGPPGTGKTDVAVQIIANLYHNNPDQRTLIVTHSNQALNQLFEKIMQLDIEEHHLLRLGRGEENLETSKDFSRYGRVDAILQQRIDLLQEVDRLARTLKDVSGDVAATCETAGHFHLYHVEARWELFLSKVRKSSAPYSAEDVQAIAAQFPFTEFFSNAPQPMFKQATYEEDMEVALGCKRYLDGIFTKLEEFRPFELLHKGRDRSKYLLVKEAKIIAMTCTHAALTRRDLVAQGFKYDNVIMEEAAQILEVETFIPLVLQNPQDGYNRLKRVVLIGDHHQLPPVIKNMAFKKFSNMEQSMFTRFVRLGVPLVQLDAQGRARPSLSSLYSWRYENLGDLPHTKTNQEFLRANGGLRYEYQFIDCGDFNGKGESTPDAYYYQNLGEAEYVVALYMYLRLLGHPSSRITMLTTYNGQKDLLKDIVQSRCAKNPMFGRPNKIETVDKYQGSQNDIILLSLVRTKAVGHIRDIRRLVVALSRARLGLYIFGRKSVFSSCYELSKVMKMLETRPTKLHLYPDETVDTRRAVTDTAAKPLEVEDMSQLAQFVYDKTMEAVKGKFAVAPPGMKRQDTEPVKDTPMKDAEEDEAAPMDTEAVESPTGKRDRRHSLHRKGTMQVTAAEAAKILGDDVPEGYTRSGDAPDEPEAPQMHRTGTMQATAAEAAVILGDDAPESRTRSGDVEEEPEKSPEKKKDSKRKREAADASEEETTSKKNVKTSPDKPAVQISSLLVRELKGYLEELNQPTKGVKKALAKRLKDVLATQPEDTEGVPKDIWTKLNAELE